MAHMDWICRQAPKRNIPAVSSGVQVAGDRNKFSIPIHEQLNMQIPAMQANVMNR